MGAGGDIAVASDCRCGEASHEMSGERHPEIPVGGISVSRDCSTCTPGCYAPVFRPKRGAFAFLIKIGYEWLLAVLVLILILSGGNPSVGCRVWQMRFRLEHWDKGNTDWSIDFEPDSYATHVRQIKESYGRTDLWEQWMLATRDRWELVFHTARQRPAAIVVAFQYHSAAIAYNPAWSSKVEHMTALKRAADLSYACYDFQFAFGGDTAASFANVTAGIPTNNSYQSGKNLYLYFETIFAHEFGHVMGVRHHYDQPDASDAPAHMPPGETLCLMARNSSQWCSACRTALCIPLDVDHEAAIDAALQEIMRRYPY